MATLLLSRRDIEGLLTPQLCIEAVEDAFRQLAQGHVPAPGILGMHAGEGGFHVKAGLLTVDGRRYFAAKLNANFPTNAARGLPTIQGAVLLSDATCGVPLAIMDSISITALRTAAATALAARYLALQECETALVCGCGVQAGAQLRSLLSVRMPRRVLVHDIDRDKASRFATAMAAELAVPVTPVREIGDAVAASQIVITCTSAHRFFVARDMVSPGTFIAAVGADHEDKQEIDPALLADSTVVTDVTEQACRIGDLHHAIAAGLMSKEQVYAELGEVADGQKPGRRGASEVIVFDSTGTGLQDVAAAIAVYRRAQELAAGQGFVLSEPAGD
jgi:alanine dehydrogenase